VKTLLLFLILTVTWQPGKDATGYEVYLKVSGQKAEVIPVGNELIFETPVDNKKTYTVKVRSVNSVGKSPWTKKLTLTNASLCYQR